MQEELLETLIAMFLGKFRSCQVLNYQFYMKREQSRRIFSEVNYLTECRMILTVRGTDMFLTHKFSAFVPFLSVIVQTTEILNEIVVRIL